MKVTADKVRLLTGHASETDGAVELLGSPQVCESKGHENSNKGC
jgi:hypothetical protein